MSLFALVFGGAIVEIAPATFPVNPALAWTGDVSGITPDPQVGWAAVETAGAWTFTAPAAPVPPPPTAAQLQAYANAKVNALLAATNPYTAAGVTLKADATGATIANLLALSQWGAANPTVTENWIANDLSVTPITGAQFAAIAPLVGAYAQLLYGTQLAAVLAQIADGTITTTAQIDAYAWTA